MSIVYYSRAAVAIGSLLTLASASTAAVNSVAYYRLGESDPGATVGSAASPITRDQVSSANDLTLSSGSPTYAAGIPSASNVSVNFPGGSGTYSKGAFSGITNNFGIETYFHVSSFPRVTQVYNGFGGTDGFGFFLGSDASSTGNPQYSGLFGGLRFLPTSTDAAVGDNVYMALVERDSVPAVFLSVNGGALQSFTFASGTPNSASSNFSIGSGFDGPIDETRLFTFASGQFSTSDLLFPSVPEPTSLSLLMAGAVGLLARRRRA